MRPALTEEDIIRAAARPAGERSDYDLAPWLSRPETRLREAAVLIGIVPRESGLHVILTKRPETMRDHAGQIAFPGGKIDPGDKDAADAALREAGEEVGLARGEARLLGEIDAYETGTGYRIQPIVALIRPGFTPVPEPGEVEEIFEPPLDFLMDPARMKRHSAVWRGERREYYAVPWRGYYIWGATAGILKNLSDRIYAEARADT